jgi:hypothetical protein
MLTVSHRVSDRDSSYSVLCGARGNYSADEMALAVRDNVSDR